MAQTVTGQIGYRVLGIYLNDHLAGATAGTDLAHRVARTNRVQEQGGQLKAPGGRGRAGPRRLDQHDEGTRYPDPRL